MTIKLNDTQLVLLSGAAQREDRCLVASQQTKGGAAKKAAAKLIEAGLVREVKARVDMPVWRRDEDEGQAYALKLTAAGLKAIAVEDDAPAIESDVAASESLRPGPSSSEKRSRRGAASQAQNLPSTEGQTPSADQGAILGVPRGGSKLATVIALLQRKTGATLDELIEATGWLPHTTRAALTGLRKRHYQVFLDKSDKGRGSVYRIAVGYGGAAAKARPVQASKSKRGGPITNVSSSNDRAELKAISSRKHAGRRKAVEAEQIAA